MTKSALLMMILRLFKFGILLARAGCLWETLVMIRKDSEYKKAAELGTRDVGMSVLASRVGKKNGSVVSRIMIGPHDSKQDAQAFVSTIIDLLQNQNSKTTDYDSWGFLFSGDDIFGGRYFQVAPVSYYERHRDFDGNPKPFFHLPATLGFKHDHQATFRYAGDESECRKLLLRLGMKELDIV
jgi:hypothetical protein